MFKQYLSKLWCTRDVFYLSFHVSKEIKATIGIFSDKPVVEKALYRYWPSPNIYRCRYMAECT